MIWVIGDIHGMFDALKKLLFGIRFTNDHDPIKKVIFIGNYIDYGPCSKDVMDLIMRFEYPKVLLTGNHEYLARRFIEQKTDSSEDFGNQWFANAAINTYESIYDYHKQVDMFKKLQQNHINKNKVYDKDMLLNYNDLKLPKKYERFIKSLKYVHREIIDVGDGRKVGFTFCHGLPRWDQTLKEQRVRSYAAFKAYLARVAVIAGPGQDQLGNQPDIFRPGRVRFDDSFLWGREYNYRCGYQGDVVVHGHVPTVRYKDVFPFSSVPEPCREQFDNYPSRGDWPFLFSRAPGAGYDASEESSGGHWIQCRSIFEHSDDEEYVKNVIKYHLAYNAGRHYSCGSDDGLEAINVDTGAVHGGALTALGLSSKYLARGLMPLITVKTSDNYRQNSHPLHRIIHVSGFGGRRSRLKKPSIDDFTCDNHTNINTK
ncbi:MAG: metallophosphoesterase [Deltaproteobacteria bacterium]|jgi:hypothetical protein|nr:metallophosphoesterase [Deltaproteobacteria bacterium]